MGDIRSSLSIDGPPVPSKHSVNWATYSLSPNLAVLNVLESLFLACSGTCSSWSGKHVGGPLEGKLPKQNPQIIIIDPCQLQALAPTSWRKEETKLSPIPVTCASEAALRGFPEATVLGLRSWYLHQLSLNICHTSDLHPIFKPVP